MGIEATLARGRAAAEALMVDACVIKRVSSSTTDPNTGVVTPTYSTIYTGKCRVQQARAQGASADVGEAALVLLRHEVQLPITVTGLQEGDQVTITASVNDADLVNRVFVVRDLGHKTHLTARRVQVSEVTS
jgi:hypothetical protein